MDHQILYFYSCQKETPPPPRARARAHRRYDWGMLFLPPFFASRLSCVL